MTEDMQLVLQNRLAQIAVHCLIRVDPAAFVAELLALPPAALAAEANEFRTRQEAARIAQAYADGENDRTKAKILAKKILYGNNPTGR